MPHPIPMLQFKSEMVEKKKFKRFCPCCERYWVCPSEIPVNLIYSTIFMNEDVEEADVFDEDVQMFEFLLRRLFQVRNLLLVEDDLSERRGKWRSPRAPILLMEMATQFLFTLRHRRERESAISLSTPGMNSSVKLNSDNAMYHRTIIGFEASVMNNRSR